LSIKVSDKIDAYKEDAMKKSLIGLIALGLLGGGLALSAQDRPAPAPRAKAAPAAPGQRALLPLERLKNALGLTDDQVAKLQDQRKAQQESQKTFRDGMQKLRGELAPLLRDPKADPNKVNGLFDQIARLGAERAKKLFSERQGLAKVLTPDQMTKLRNLRGGAMDPMGRGMMGPGMRQRMGPQGRGMMMGPRGGMMMGPGRGMRQGLRGGMGMGARPGMNARPGLRLRILRWLRGWRGNI
jgi:Spy/CpxP family protein refolding chaperone